MKQFIPFIIALSLATILYLIIGWWGGLIIFPWIGGAVSLDIYLRKTKSAKQSLDRKISTCAGGNNSL